MKTYVTGDGTHDIVHDFFAKYMVEVMDKIARLYTARCGDGHAIRVDQKYLTISV
jgi:hypothetical protein